MAVTFHSEITLRPGSVFCFGTISSVADEEGILHRIADPPEKKSPPMNPENAGEAQPPALRKKIVSGKSEAEGSLTRKTPLSTSPTKEWTRIARKKETREKQVVLSVPRRPLHRESGVAHRLRRRANRTRRRTASTRIPPTEESAQEHSTTSCGRRTGSGVACLARRGLGDRRNPERTRLPRTKELPTTRSPTGSGTSRARCKATPGESILWEQPESRLRPSHEHAERSRRGTSSDS
jgi:hypothetical protein